MFSCLVSKISHANLRVRAFADRGIGGVDGGVAWAGLRMVVDDAAGLQVGIDGCRPQVLESTLLEIFANAI